MGSNGSRVAPHWGSVVEVVEVVVEVAAFDVELTNLTLSRPVTADGVPPHAAAVAPDAIRRAAPMA